MLIVVAICLLVSYASAACPRIISRDEWGARQPYGTYYHEVPVPYAVIHHSDTIPCFNQSACIEMMQYLQNLHMDTNLMTDIGYSFVVGEDGNIYQGRGWNVVGSHATGYNFHSQGICVIGNFTEVLPNEAALSAVKALIECGIELGNITPTYELLGHRQAIESETLCPGDMFYNEIVTWPHYNPHP